MADHPLRPMSRRVLAWSAHAVTASGAIVGFMTLLAITEHNLRTALLWMILALTIDGIDGFFARLCKVKDTLPTYDGRMLDWVLDYLNFVFLPAYLFYAAKLVAPTVDLICVAGILLSAAYHFGNKSAVTAAGHYRGFPAFWNIIVAFLVLMQASTILNVLLVACFCILHFIPIQFVYPTRGSTFKTLTWVTSSFATTFALLAILDYPERTPFLPLSLSGMALLVFIGLYLTITSQETLRT